MSHAPCPFWRPLLLAGTVLCTTPAFAQAQTDPTVPAQQLPTPDPSTTRGGDVQSRRAEAPQTAVQEDPYKDLNRLVFKGWITPVPTIDDSLTRDAGGWRSTLAKAGFGLSLFSVNLGVYDLAQAGSGIGGPQLYNGQKFTVQSSNQTAYLTYDVGRISHALEGGQLVAIGVWTTNGYQARDGLRGFRLRGAYWYQPLFGGKVEMEAGLITNSNDYVGTNVGGSLAGGALGPQASIPVEAGISYAQYGAPTLSAKINWTREFYTRTAIQRSISPQGSTAEAERNPSGVTLTVPGAKPLFIQEVGYRIAATPGTRSFWLRAGGIYNTSNYRRLDGTGTSDNHAIYVAVDRQLTQPDSLKPARGVYVGATADFAPQSVDLIHRYYEGRVYVKGPFAARPNDMASVVATANVYGLDGRIAQTLPGFTPSKTTQTYTGSYSFRVTHGFYLQPGISVVVHPVYNRDIGTAVNGLFSITTFF